ncbi:lamin tail domain-containing protein [bacterium]|nr:lamin tail domain-containing protein [bacterium]
MRKQIIFLACLLITNCLAAPSDGLLAYWNLDNNTTDSAPSGATNDNGSWIGGSSYSSSNAQFGAAGVFNGSNYISIPSSSDIASNGGSLTISVWCQVGTWDTSWQALLSKGEGTNYRIARQSNDQNAISYAGGSADIGGGAVNDGNWHHIMAVSEAGEGTYLYVDGQEVATGVAPSLTDQGLNLLIGENPGATGRRWNGGIDDVAIFDAPLSASQARAIHDLGTIYGYPMGDAIQILDAHDTRGAVTIGNETWSYEPTDTGSGTFIPLGNDLSGVDLSAGPSITLFESSPIFITSGGTATLSWQISPPFSAISIDNGIGSVLAQTDGSGAGSISVSPTISTTYTVTATNVDGDTLRSTNLFVDVDPSTPRINEFSADTAADGLLDEDGDTEDWIEIYNPGPNAADLSTFYLTDDITALSKWAIPAVVMQPDTYLIIFASGKDRAVAGNELHTNFRLSANGEYLALTRDDGSGGFTVAGEFSPVYPSQEEGFSYGFAPDGLTLGFLETPTPDAPNGAVAQGFVADTTFDIDRGFYTAPFNLTISTATPDAQIRYTTDGSEPTATNGIIYSGPINISSTTTIRAAAFKAGFFETNVDTHTYFFLDDVRTQYANGAAPSGWPAGPVNGQVFNYGMDPDITNRYSSQEMIDALSAIPSISLSTNQANLTGGGSQGIYVNPGSRGRSWERPASFEVIHPDGTTRNLQSNCGIRIRGGFSRSTANPKHAFRIFFRNEYGDGKLNYPMFGAEGVDQFDKLDLRTSQNYSWAFQNSTSNTFLREVLGRDLQRSFERPYTRSRYYHLYLNGIYWGLFMTQERAEANHGEAYLGGDDQNYDTIKSAGSSGGYNTEATDGSFATGSEWSTLWSMSRNQQTNPTDANFMMMQGLNPDGSRNPSLPIYLDVDNLIDYQMIIGYTGNYDAPLSDFVGASNNWYAVRDRERDSFGFQFFVHDGEHSMGAGGKWNGANDRINTTNGAGSRTSYNKSNPSFLHFDLTEGTEEYRLRFADRAHLALFNSGQLTRDRVFALMDARRSTVSDVIIAESARWGDSKRTDPLDEQDWINAVNSLIGIINNRSEDFLGHLRLADLYPDLAAPRYSQHGGKVTPGTSINAIVPTTGTHFYYMIGTGDPDETDWQDALDPRLLGGSVNPAASMLAINGGGGGGVVETDYINNGESWKYLDDGSNQGTAWRNPAFNDSLWASGNAELGYGDGDETTTVDSGPNNAKFATTYFRTNVTIPDPSVFGDFQLRITYDDAYVVYVNGAEVARLASLPANPAFDLYSGNTVGDNAIDSLSIPVSAFSAGQNTIAVEVHQGNGTSSDLSFDLSLTGRPEGGGETIVLNLPETINEPVWIKSRTYNSISGTWSALNQAFFSTAEPATPTDIVISEVHYHPTEPTAAELAVDPTFDQDDFEFIEILNIGSRTVDLGDAAFVLIPVDNNLEGVEFTFPQGTLIAPGQRLVIAANATAFAARYPGVAIAGDYSSRLSNTREWVTLVDRDGNVIDSFRYNDISPWPESADGTGPSLVRISPGSDLDPNLSTSWTSSPTSGGSPGAADGTPFVGDPLADLDGDGFVAIIEYAQGLSDTVFSAGEHIDTSTIDVAGVIYPAFSFREDPNATDASISVEVSPGLATGTWIGGGASLIFVNTVNDPDGIPRHTYRLNTPFSSTSQHFFRLKVIY